MSCFASSVLLEKAGIPSLYHNGIPRITSFNTRRNSTFYMFSY